MTSFPPFRRRTYGPRCASPPTFVCYELPQPEDSYSRTSSPSQSEDGSDHGDCSASDFNSNSDEEIDGDEDEVDIQSNASSSGKINEPSDHHAPSINGMNTTEDATAHANPENSSTEENEQKRLQEKREGKKKAKENDDNGGKRHRKSARRRRRDEPAPAIRPILTIRSSQGFVWNQDLFIPPYIKDRYIASSPPSSFPSHRGTPTKSSALVNNNFFSSSGDMDWEVECHEIRLQENELSGLVP